ncbi:hypothetical protein Scep_002989 [Stephania cephalantha]|uniref:non-specific serine/threonine protein kinase n=1 Tax=Stephania cephalantha TaxID=152367 RepID=A0AAP0Q5I0_9MAGN
MEQLVLAFLLMMDIFLQSSYATLPHSLSKGSSLSVEKPNDVLKSSNGVFAAGFHSVGDNAYCFAVWFTQSAANSTIVWMANRDQPVNGRGSVVSLLGDGNLVLRDVGEIDTWESNTRWLSQVELALLDTGNLVLQTPDNDILWESFKFPTDTLLPYQQITRHAKLISPRSKSNYSSGWYSFYFDNDNLLHLLYNGPETSSAYWPDPSNCWPLGRYKFNNSRVAFFNSSGDFQSSDQFVFSAADLGIGPKRRLTMDFDGNLRLYSLQEKEGKWLVSWQAFSQPCSVHGVCGPNSICVHGLETISCSCLPGFKVKYAHDWSYGCEPKFNLSFDVTEWIFFALPNVNIYGFDLGTPLPKSEGECKKICVQSNSTCKAVSYINGTCQMKSMLFNAVRSPNLEGITYLMLPKNSLQSYNESEEKSTQAAPNCPSSSTSTTDIQLLERVYLHNQGNQFLLYLLWFVTVIGGIELFCICIGFFYLYRARGHTRRVYQGYDLFVAAAGFRKFTYNELKKATWSFSQEIGRGGYGIVYKGVLSDGRLVTWVREKNINASSSSNDHDIASTIEEILDPRVDAQYSMAKMEVLLAVALQCVQEEKDRRPTMSKVVEMLTRHDYT